MTYTIETYKRWNPEFKLKFWSTGKVELEFISPNISNKLIGVITDLSTLLHQAADIINNHYEGNIVDNDKIPDTEPAINPTCYCSDFNSAGVPCPPGRCPNKPVAKQ